MRNNYYTYLAVAILTSAIALLSSVQFNEVTNGETVNQLFDYGGYLLIVPVIFCCAKVFRKPIKTKSLVWFTVGTICSIALTRTPELIEVIIKVSMSLTGLLAAFLLIKSNEKLK